jgi:hypothetical protein
VEPAQSCHKSLFALHVIACCVSLVYVGQIYAYLSAIPAFNWAPASEAFLAAGSFALMGTVLFLLSRFSFGYLIGFYLFTVALGYLWIVAFSRLAYDHPVAAASAFASAIAFLVPALLSTTSLELRFALPDTAIKHLLFGIIVAGMAVISIGAFYNFKASSPNRVGDFLSFLPDLYTDRSASLPRG